MKPVNSNSPINSLKNKPKKMVTRQTTKITNQHTQRVSKMQTIKTSHENITIKVTEQYQHRKNMAKMTSTTNIINNIKQTFNDNERDALHKIVSSLKQIETVKQMRDGKLKKQKRTQEKSYEQILSDDDDNAISQQWDSRIDPPLKQQGDKQNQSHNPEIQQFDNNSGVFKQAESSMQKKAASQGGAYTASTIPIDYQAMLDNFMKHNKQGKKLSAEQKIQVFKDMISDPSFKDRNIIRYPSWASDSSNNQDAYIKKQK